MGMGFARVPINSQSNAGPESALGVSDNVPLRRKGRVNTTEPAKT
jgi:hypothetical protein